MKHQFKDLNHGDEPVMEITGTETHDEKPRIFTSEEKTISSAGLVNFRSAPEMDDNVIEVLQPGTKVVVIGVTGDWASVHVNGKDGYVMNHFLK